MKLFEQLFLVIMCTMAFGSAEAQKMAHIESDVLIKSMPEYDAMQAELKKLQQTYADEYNTQVASFEAKLKKYQAEAPTQTDIKNQERDAEINGLRQKIEKYTQTAQQEMEKKGYDLLQPILKKVTQTIKVVAAEKEINYVFDSTPGKGILVFDKGEDLLPAVKAKLGIP